LLLEAGAPYVVNVTVYGSGARLYLSYVTAKRHGVAAADLASITDELAAIAGSRAAPVSNRDYPGLILEERLTGPTSAAAVIKVLDRFLEFIKVTPKK
jgi:hypothetical protein